MSTARSDAPFAAAPVRLPSRMTLANEFIHLIDLRARVQARLEELAELVLSGHPALGLPPLPGSGPPAGRSDYALFEGGRDDG